MVVIVEGIDRVGKTTLCNMLKDQLGFLILKKDRETKFCGDSVSKSLLNYGTALGMLEMSKYCRNVCIDRFHWTEYVYDSLRTGVPNEYMLDIEDKILKRKDIMVVYVKPVDIRKSSEEHGSDLSDHLELFEWIRAQHIWDNGRNNYYECDYSGLKYAVEYVKGRMLK